MEKFKMYVPDANELFGFAESEFGGDLNQTSNVKKEGSLDWQLISLIVLLVVVAGGIILYQANKIKYLNLEILTKSEDTQV